MKVWCQETKEIWKKGEFVEFVGHTDFEDEREYFINGKDNEKNFVANGMDGELILNKDILLYNEFIDKFLIFDISLNNSIIIVAIAFSLR